eukprot:gene906-1269_t
MVQSYTTTADTRYLTYYYELLDIRDGKRMPPDSADLELYWHEIVAGRRTSAPPQAGKPRTLIESMQALDFTDRELQA